MLECVEFWLEVWQMMRDIMASGQASNPTEQATALLEGSILCVWSHVMLSFEVKQGADAHKLCACAFANHEHRARIAGVLCDGLQPGNRVHGGL